MAQYIEKIENLSLPLVVLNGNIAFPSITLNFELSEKENIQAVEAATSVNSFIFIVSKKSLSEGPIDYNDLYKVGTVSKIKQTVKTKEGTIRIIAEGFSRAKVENIVDFADYKLANVMCKTLTLKDENSLKVEAYLREAVNSLSKISSFLPASSDETISTAKTIKNPGILADFIASNVLIRHTDKQEILAIFEPIKRIIKLIVILEEEIKLLDTEKDIHQEVRSRLNRNQKEFYLREQMKVIREELGDNDSEDDEYVKKINKLSLPKETKEKLLKDAERMSKLPFGSAELSVMRTYFDTVLDIPFDKATKDTVSVSKAREVLDADHDGLIKVKERILEFLSVKELNKDINNQIICLVGPPGVGKTSIASSIAKAMGRKYVRVSLGGVRDEADIRGHRKTYIGAMPGRIVNALIEAKVSNPLILLDEIDKLTSDAHGDPTSALLEVLDSEQNKAFRDHFVEFPIDLSKCFFIATANTLDTIPRPLIDRMEIIELKIYTKREKIEIAKHHLVEKQMKRHGLKKSNIKFTDEALELLVDKYTHEAGVRNLEREIASICRKVAMEIVDKGAKSVVINEAKIKEYLGKEKVYPLYISNSDEVGTVNGLAYTELGGDMLKIEVSVLDGDGKLELTGSLGDVMKESAKIAVSYVRSIAKNFNIDPEFYKKKDIHIHAPEGAVPKDGPSAGVTMATALVSALSGLKVKRDVAMTGEITLRGNVLAIGGLKEKTMAAYTAGVKTVFIPYENIKDLDEIDILAKENLEFVAVKNVSEILDKVLIKDEKFTLREEVLPNIVKTSEEIKIGGIVGA